MKTEKVKSGRTGMEQRCSEVFRVQNKSRLLEFKQRHRIPTLSPFKKMLVLVITAGQRELTPLALYLLSWHSLCCSCDQGSLALPMLFRHNLFSLLLGTKETIKKTIQ